MAFNTVPTVATGDLWTAANHNTFVRDNFNAGVPAIFSAKGDLAIGDGDKQAIRLPLGTMGQIPRAVPGAAVPLQYGSLFQNARRFKFRTLGLNITAPNGSFSANMPVPITEEVKLIDDGYEFWSSGNVIKLRQNYKYLLGIGFVYGSSTPTVDSMGIVALFLEGAMVNRYLDSYCRYQANFGVTSDGELARNFTMGIFNTDLYLGAKFRGYNNTATIVDYSGQILLLEFV